MKGLLLFASVCLNYDVVCLCHAQNRQFIDGKLEQNEANLQKLFKKYLLNRLVQNTVYC